MSELQRVGIELPGAAAPVDLRHVYLEQFDSLLRLASLLVGSSSLAEELVQDSFARLLERPPGLVSANKLESYVRSTVLNACRSKIRRLVLERRHGEGSAIAATDSDIELPDKELREALLSLPIRQRQCVALRYYDDQTVDAIADLLGISAGSVKTHIHRGLGQLRHLLEDSK